MEKRERFVPRFVLCITSLLSVSTGSNRAAVAGNCSSSLPEAPRVQSRIHEFLVRSPPLRSFFTYVSTSASTSSAPRHYLVLRLLCTVCARRISHTRVELTTERNRSTSIEICARARARDYRNCKVCRLLYLLPCPANRYWYCL